MYFSAVCVCPDGSWPAWPWSAGEPVITSAPRELVRRLLAGTALDRALAAAELTPEQHRQLFRGRSARERYANLARLGRRARELELVEFVRAQSHVDERSLAWWFQGARGDVDDRRAEFFRRFIRGKPGRVGVTA